MMARNRGGKPVSKALHRWSGGFTLMELLLVLAIMAAVGMMTWPSLRRSMADYRLRTAADTVRTEWCIARIEAMQSGEKYTFACGTERDRFAILPASEGESAGSNESSPLDEASPPSGSTTSETSSSAEKVLPEGIEFRSLSVDEKTDTSSGGGAATITTDASLSPTVSFYPDGTTSDARLTLGNEQGRTVELTLRGLTGAVTVGAVGVEGQMQ
jgi:prepilin-type N-terminal cleavage/methylation domain-containing protein